MILGILLGLFGAWILTLVNFDAIAIDVLQDFTDVVLTTSHFYFFWGVIGGVAGLFKHN